MTMKEAQSIIDSIYAKYKKQHSEIDQIFIESDSHFEANPDGHGGHWVHKTPEEIQDGYGMSDADKAAIKEAQDAIAQIKSIYSLYEGTSTFFDIKFIEKITNSPIRSRK